jgi:two-component system chemotaxis sensor kinase CheA
VAVVSGGLLAQFLVEARELIQEASDDLLALERDPEDAERIDRTFRAFHTLKGSAALFAFEPLTSALHAAEDLLAGLREGRLAGGAGSIADLVLTVLDQAMRWLDAIEAEGDLPAGAAEASAEIVGRLRRAIGEDHREVARPSGDAASPPDWVARLTEGERAAIRSMPREGDTLALAITYDPDADCFFHGDDPLGQMRRVPGLAVCRIEAPDSWPQLSRMDVFRCQVRLRAVALMPSAEAAELRARFRLLGPQARVDEIPADLLLPAASFPARPTTTDAALARAVLEEQRRMLAAGGASPAGSRPGRVAAAARAAANALRFAGHPDAAARVEAACATDPALRDADQVDRAIEEALLSAAPRVGAAAPDRRGGRLLRVDPAKVDRLVALADEMVLARNALQHLLRRAEEQLDAGQELVRGLKDQHGTLERLAREWHEAAVRMRMVPVEEVFRRFPRLVRELSRQLGKMAELVIEGERTEADRDLVENLFEPLLHVLRNSLDHGIEPPDERQRTGKREAARLVLRAFQEADRVVIEVEDDGRGVNADLVRRRAVQRGAIDAERAAALTDAEAVELVFISGVSTAEAVSDISGRGIGMDAVRHAAERAGGTASIHSRPGEGTAIRLSLPLSVRLTQILVIRVDKHLFGLPLDTVLESVRVPEGRVQKLRDGAEAFALNDRILPLIPLRRVLELPAPDRAGGAEDRHVIVVQADGQEAGLQVDEVGDRLEVILRPLGGLLAGMRGYLGTTLLGSGRATLVLDVREALR